VSSRKHALVVLPQWRENRMFGKTAVGGNRNHAPGRAANADLNCTFAGPGEQARMGAPTFLTADA
jgi:hypothetical protein